MPRPKRPLPPEIGILTDREVALAEAERGYYTTPGAIQKLRERRGIPPACPPGWPNQRNKQADD